MNEKEFKQIKEKFMSEKIEEKERLLKEIAKQENQVLQQYKEYSDVKSLEYNLFDHEKNKYYRIVQIPFTEEEYEMFKIINEEIDKLKESLN